MDNKEYLNQIFKEEEEPRVDRRGIPDYEELFNENRGNSKPAVGILKALGKQNAFRLFMSGILFLLKDVTLYIPIFTANIINAVTMDSNDKYSVMWLNFILMTLVVASNIPTHIWYSRFSDKMLRTVSAGMRNTLVKKLQHLSLTYHNFFVDSMSFLAKEVHDSLSFFFLMFSMQFSSMAGSAKYLSISVRIASGVPSFETSPVPLSPMVSFSPPTSVTIIGTSKW